MLSLQASPQQTVGGSPVSEFLRLDNGFYYAEQIQCFPETNLFKYHSLLGRKYSQYTNPESQQANVSVVLSRKPLPIPDSVYDGVAGSTAPSTTAWRASIRYCTTSTIVLASLPFPPVLLLTLAALPLLGRQQRGGRVRRLEARIPSLPPLPFPSNRNSRHSHPRVADEPRERRPVQATGTGFESPLT